MTNQETSSYTSLVLETERLVLRPITASVEDATFYLALMNSPKWIQNIGDRKVYTVEAAQTYISAGMVPQWVTKGYGNYVVLRKGETLEPVGCCGIFTRPGLEHADLGFAFLPAFEKQGYATESSKRVIQEAFEVFGFTTMQAITDFHNVDCQKLLQRLDFTFKGEITLPNETKPIMLYVLEKTSA